MRTIEAAWDPLDNRFTAVRGALAVAVLWSHCWPIATGRSDPVFVLTGASVGGLAVDAFFVVSGFLVARSWLRDRDPAAYARRRLLRLVPALLVVCAISALAIGPFTTTLPPTEYFRSPGTWAHLLAGVRGRALYCPGVFDGNPLRDLMNGSLWSIRYEVACYVVLPLLAATGRRGLAAAVALAIATAPRVALPWFDPSWLAHHLLACFAFGALCWVARDAVPIGPAAVAAAAAGLVVAARAGLLESLFPVLGGYLVLAAAVGRRAEGSGQDRPRQSDAAARESRRADLSYGLYLWAFPLQQVVVQAAGGRMDPWLLFAIALPATAAVALASWRFVEAPALAIAGRPRDEA